MAKREDVIVLVGMSGVGKSHRAAELGRAGAHVVDCDARIAARLSSLVTVGDGESPVVALGRWMGLPSSDGYREREAAYLALEAEVTAGAATEAAAHAGRVVVDTTGSVVHLADDLLAELRRVGRVVYLRVDPDRHAEMLTRYLAEPKPVVFGAAWDGRRSLAEAYSELLRWRDGRYAAIADEVVAAHRR